MPIATRSAFFSELDKTLQQALTQNLQDPFWFDTTRYPNHIDIRVAVDGGVLRFIAARERVFAPTGYVFIFWLVTATILLTLVSVLFIRNQAKPIAKLAAAADAFGKGQDISNFKPTGASEVRLAGQSFMKMRQRIKRHIEQRTVFLAGVSHDLRTPLTRLNLHLAMQDDTSENKAARRDFKRHGNHVGWLSRFCARTDRRSISRDGYDNLPWRNYQVQPGTEAGIGHCLRRHGPYQSRCSATGSFQPHQQCAKIWRVHAGQSRLPAGRDIHHCPKTTAPAFQKPHGTTQSNPSSAWIPPAIKILTASD